MPEPELDDSIGGYKNLVSEKTLCLALNKHIDMFVIYKAVNRRFKPCGKR